MEASEFFGILDKRETSENIDEFTQYAKEVTSFSSQYGSETSISYTACNLAGRSNIFPNYGDYTQACVLRTYGPWWDMAPSAKTPFKRTPPTFCSEDFVELAFEIQVYPVRIEISETYNPGAIIRILACDTTGGTDVDTGSTTWEVLWESPDGPEKAEHVSRKFSPELKMSNFPTNLLRIEFCHRHCHYYTELDCVVMYGAVPTRSKGRQLANEIKDCSNPDSLVAASTLRIQNLILDDIKTNQNTVKRETTQNKLEKNLSQEIQSESDSTIPELSEDYLCGNGYFNLLPNEVIQLILSYLDLPSLCRMSRTCSLLHKHCYDPLQYTEVNLQPYWTLVNNNTLDSLHTRCIRIQRLNLSWCGGNSGVIESQTLRRFLEVCGSELLCLYMSSCIFVTSEVLKAIADYCPKLKELDLQSCRGVDGPGLAQLCKLKHLQRLNLYRTLVDKNSINQLIKVSPDLRHLNLGSCSRIDNFDDVAKELGKHCKNLTSLDLWRARTITETGIEALANNCLELQELDVGWCSDLRSRTEFLTNLVQSCCKLKKIFLTANRTICDADLLAIAHNCKDLEQLDILGTRQISKESVYEVLKKCPKMKMFDLSFCERIDFNAVEQWNIEFPHVDIKKSFQN